MTTQHLFNRLNNKQLTEIIREHNLDSEIKPYYHKPNNFIVNKLLEHLTIDNSGFIVIKEHNVIVKPQPEGRFKEKSEEEKTVKKQVIRQKKPIFVKNKKAYFTRLYVGLLIVLCLFFLYWLLSNTKSNFPLLIRSLMI